MTHDKLVMFTSFQLIYLKKCIHWCTLVINNVLPIFLQIWLIEINVNPCLATNCEALKEVVPGVVQETLGSHFFQALSELLWETIVYCSHWHAEFV